MFYPTKPRKSLILLLAAAMLLFSLSACGKPEELPASDHTSGSDQGPDPVTGPNRNEFLASAFDGAMEDLRERFDASPFSPVERLLDSKSLTADFTSTVSADDLPFSGRFISDRFSGMAEMALTLPETGLEARLHYNSEFAGISCEPIFGDGRWYGLRPYGLAQQLEGSGLASVLSLDMEAVRELDGILETLPQDAYTYSAPLFDSFAALTHSLIETLNLREKSVRVTVNGAETEGKSYTATLGPDKLARYLRKLAAGGPELALLYGALSGDSGAADLGAVIDSIESGGVDTDLTFTVAGDRVRSIAAEYKSPGSTVYLEAELYGDTGDLVRVALKPYFDLELTLDADVHMSLNTHSGNGSATTLDWTADGEFDFITYSTDVTTLALEGTLTVSDGELRYEGIWFTGNRGDRNPLSLTCVPGGEVAAPEDTVSLAELSEREIFLIVTRAVLGQE